MPCSCISRRKKERPPPFLPLQTDLAHQSPTEIVSLPGQSSPFLKLGRMTLLDRIEKAFNHLQVEEKVKAQVPRLPISDSVWFTISQTGAPALEVELPPPIRPESVILASVITQATQAGGIQAPCLQAPTNIYEMLPKRPRSIGCVHDGRQPLPEKLVLDLPPQSQAHKLMTQPNARNSQFAVVLDTAPHSFQPPISPEPTPTFDKSNSSFQKACLSPNSSAFSPGSTGFPANILPQCATVLRPRYTEILTPPLTPPPNIPLPPIPAASYNTRTNRTSSLPMISRPASMEVRSDNPPISQDSTGDAGLGSPLHRPRSKSSPLRTVTAGVTSCVTSSAPRRVRFQPSSDSMSSGSDTTNDTNLTSEENLPTSSPIALFECSYSPPPAPPSIRNFAKQLHPSTTPPHDSMLHH